MPKPVRATSAEQRARWLRDPETILADVLTAQRNARKRTDPMPLHVLKAVQAGRARWETNKRKAALARVLARQKAQRRAKAPVLPRVLLAMTPGEWYGLNEIGRALGFKKGIIGRVGQTMRERGLLDRVPNPKWDPVSQKYTPGAIMAGLVREPKWLWRLSEAGQREREAAAASNETAAASGQ